MKPYFGWLVILAFSSALLGSFYAIHNATIGTPLDITLATTTASSVAAAAVAVPMAAEPPPSVPEGYKEYRSDDHHFSVYYPGDIPPQESHDPGFALTVEFQKGDGDPGFQIYVAPIAGSTITKERFLMDEPSGVRKDEKEASVDGAPGIAFHGFDPRIGQTYEVWFIKDNLLYELVTYKQLEPWLNDILSTWRFLPHSPLQHI